ncbi:MAG: hypothetical protein JWR38_1782 [Mucilaginibacter sp.]|nr:hypothetical protein [Mucilaginibacter sp.]
MVKNTAIYSFFMAKAYKYQDKLAPNIINYRFRGPIVYKNNLINRLYLIWNNYI